MRMDVSIGTNMLECGPPWRMERRHLAPLAEAGARAIDLHMGARYEAVCGIPPLRSTRCFVEFHSEPHCREIARWMEELGLRAVCAHTSVMGPLDVSSTYQRIREFAVQELRAMIPFCAFLNIPVMVVHPGDRMPPGEPSARRWARVKESMTKLIPDLEKHHLKIALENLLPGSVSVALAELVQAVNDLNHPLIGVCLDTGHLNVMQGRPADAVRLIGPRLFALHVHDNHGKNDEHKPPFDGSIEWGGFAEALAEVGYAGTLNLEVLDPARRGEMADAEFIRRALAMGRRVLETE